MATITKDDSTTPIDFNKGLTIDGEYTTMATIKGTVQSKSRAGTGIKVNDKWYNGSTDQLNSVEWKAEVEFEVDDRGGIVTIKTTEGAPAPAAGGTKKKASGGWDDPKRQEVIVFQSARNASIDLLGKLIESDALKLPAKQSDKFDAALAIVNEMTIDFHKQAMAIYEGKTVDEVLGDSNEG